MKFIFAIFLLYGLIPHAWACDNNGNHIMDIRLHTAIPDSFNQKKIGDVLYSQQTSLAELGNSNNMLACSDSAERLSIAGTLSGNEAGKRVYQTSAPGIGIRIFYYKRQSAGAKNLRVLPFNENTLVTKNMPLRPEDVVLKIELIKTASASATKDLFFAQTSLLSFRTTGHSYTVNLHLFAKMPNNVCNFSSPQIVAHLPSQSYRTITAIRPATRYPLPIKISCNGPQSLIAITLSGNTYDASRGILNIEEDRDSAKGVGIQFWYHGHPVLTGKPMLLYILNQQHLGNEILLPFYVNYVKTDKIVTPGKISVAATLHIDYL